MILIKNFTRHKFDRRYLDKIADKTLRAVGIKKPVEISLVIAGEKRIRSLNKKFRGMDKITDVLSFGNEEAENKDVRTSSFFLHRQSLSSEDSDEKAGNVIFLAGVPRRRLQRGESEEVLDIKNKSVKPAKFINPPGNTLYLGEIFICYPQAEKQARRKNHSVKKELSILLIHGILHLAGYDHKREYEKSEMKVVEEKILMAL